VIDRQHGKIVFECDACDKTFEGETDDFKEEWAVAKGAGWKARKVGADWLHLCPNPRCQKQ
jgi:hypothetical protein